MVGVVIDGLNDDMMAANEEWKSCRRKWRNEMLVLNLRAAVHQHQPKCTDFMRRTDRTFWNG
jgi:hypothetical protein